MLFVLRAIFSLPFLCLHSSIPYSRNLEELSAAKKYQIATQSCSFSSFYMPWNANCGLGFASFDIDLAIVCSAL